MQTAFYLRRLHVDPDYHPEALGVAIDPGYIQLMLAAIDTNHTGGVKYQARLGYGS